MAQAKHIGRHMALHAADIPLGAALMGYDRQQVARHITQIRRDYEQVLAEQQARITALREENEALRRQLEAACDEDARSARILAGANRRAEMIIREGTREAREQKQALEEEIARAQGRLQALHTHMETAAQQAMELSVSFGDDLARLRDKTEKPAY